MYLSTTQILKRLGIERNKKNADYIRGYFDTDWINISNTNRIPIKLYDKHQDWLLETYNAKEWHPRAFEDCQINSVTNFESTILEQANRIHDLEINHTALIFRLEKAEKAISNIIEIFHNVNKLKGE